MPGDTVTDDYFRAGDTGLDNKLFKCVLSTASPVWCVCCVHDMFCLDLTFLHINSCFDASIVVAFAWFAYATSLQLPHIYKQHAELPAYNRCGMGVH